MIHPWQNLTVINDQYKKIFKIHCCQVSQWDFQESSFIFMEKSLISFQCRPRSSSMLTLAVALRHHFECDNLMMMSSWVGGKFKLTNQGADCLWNNDEAAAEYTGSTGLMSEKFWQNCTSEEFANRGRIMATSDEFSKSYCAITKPWISIIRTEKAFKFNLTLSFWGLVSKKVRSIWFSILFPVRIYLSIKSMYRHGTAVSKITVMTVWQ